MQAAIYYGRGDVRIVTVPDPPAPGPGEVVLAVLSASICGTDVSEYTHGPQLIPLHTRHHASGHLGPVILGHEFVGRIVAIGPEVTGFVLGQRVVPGAGSWCGQCPRCLAGESHLCRQYFVYGLHAHGGLADMAKVPARMCHVVPQACSDASAALAQPLAVALHALRTSGVQHEQTLVVLGVGGIGSFLLAAAHLQGISSIMALDVDDERLERAVRLGASCQVNVTRQDPQCVIHRLTAGEGADVVIEASGAPSSPPLALSLARRGGRVLLVGLQPAPCRLDLHDQVLREISLLSSNGHVCDIDLPAALTLLSTHDLATQLVDRVIPLARLVPDGLVALADKRAKGKVLIALH
jgi:(R,R)-butanediol dehydrogenase/meso-butanediol dehydrogenase/diacetyl reductase